MKNQKEISILVLLKSAQGAEQVGIGLVGSPKENLELQMYIMFEFTYLFTHLICREMFRVNTQDKKSEIMNAFGYMITEGAINPSSGHWPEHLVQGMKKEFLQKLNITELEYGKCNSLLDNSNPFSEKAILSLFGKNIVALTSNPESFLKAVELGSKYWLDIRDKIII